MFLGGSGRQLLTTAWKVAAPAVRKSSEFVDTVVLKRRFTPPLSKRSYPEGSQRRLRRRHEIYDTVHMPQIKPLPEIEVVLTQYVEGLGKPGDVVSMKVSRAHNNLLARGKADYVTPENILKYQRLAADSHEPQPSSIYSSLTARMLSRQVLAVVMNMDQPWTLEPWHVRVSFRKAGFVVPEHSVQLPERPIQGPDVQGLEGREFIVTVTINATERVPVRCRLHHYSTDPRDRLPYARQPWLQPAEPMFADEADTLAALPMPVAKPHGQVTP